MGDEEVVVLVDDDAAFAAAAIAAEGVAVFAAEKASSKIGSKLCGFNNHSDVKCGLKR